MLKFYYWNYEIVIVDDSNDGVTTQIMKKFEEKYLRGGVHIPVKVLHRETRAGWKGGALNYALQSLDPRS